MIRFFKSNDFNEWGLKTICEDAKSNNYNMIHYQWELPYLMNSIEDENYLIYNNWIVDLNGYRLGAYLSEEKKQELSLKD